MDTFISLAQKGIDSYQRSQSPSHGSSSDVSKTGGKEYNTRPDHSSRASSPDIDGDEAVRGAAKDGSGSSDLFASALSFLGQKKSERHEPIDEEEATRAHEKAYKQGNTAGLDSSALGKAAALQVLQQFVGGGSQSTPSAAPAKPSASGSSSTQLISLAMAEATKLFDKQGSSAQGNKQDAVNSAAMTIMKLLVQSKLSGGGTTGGKDSGGLGQLIGLAAQFAK